MERSWDPVCTPRQSRSRVIAARSVLRYSSGQDSYVVDEPFYKFFVLIIRVAGECEIALSPNFRRREFDLKLVFEIGFRWRLEEMELVACPCRTWDNDKGNAGTYLG